ncbi:PREDICTED: transmembrane protein 87A-like isoform X2 [Poecilia mexicana]|uniref:transmembrane protein 87A-like isoform X2 n=1 Tax=Poecilia mexicana TaxID=48701 RepID=UPI00072DBA8D|nr:PREDICTED: transmembrane protein 87A-like isoform X2 [Poecilia mexicana]XP_016522228.1 PREDICTED: transmembrane protein 87A-like isoform X2 [Poecilia formosa]
MCRHHHESGSVPLVVSCLSVGPFFVLLVRMAGSVGPGLTGSGFCCSAVLLLLLLLLAARPGLVRAVSEPGKWTVDVGVENQKPQYFVFRKTLFNGSSIHLQAVPQNCSPSSKMEVSWYLRNSHCYNEVYKKNLNPEIYFNSVLVVAEGGSGAFTNHTYKPISCQIKPYIFSVAEFDLPVALKNPLPPPSSSSALENSGRRRREAKKPEPKAAGGSSNQSDFDIVARSWEDGPYMFIIKVQKTGTGPWRLQLQVSMKGPHGFISATEWPLMVFYMVMCIGYVLLAVLWLVLSACYWRSLLRIQFWIGGVIFLGMLEKAVYYAEFQSISYEGLSVQGAVVFAEVLSAVKRTLARVLVIIASLGYGIVKPRLGALLHRVVGVGLLYLLFSIIEGILRVHTAEDDVVLLAAIPLAVLDSALCWWIFVSLAQTMKLLKLRRNVVKLSLFRHFSNTLIFAVIASVIFIIWTAKNFTMSRCRSDWREVWIQDAFWRFLFSVILLVIMFLWRPSANNQMYAFSPLVDADSEDEEEKEPMMNEAFEGMKMRGTKTETNGTARPNKVDEDLKWVEENIPSSMADIALPPLLDSDEETQTTKLEMSKME